VSEVTRESEIAAEQRHVDIVYARVDAMRAEAERMQREGYKMARARTPGSLVERDAMVYHAAQRLRALDAEYEGLVFGRLDMADREIRHIGRLGLRDKNYEPLVIDWRAPGAAPFYQATAEEPQGVVRRRVIRCSGPKVLDVEDDLLDVATATDDHAAVAVVGDGALLATLARAKTDRMRDIVATIQREQDEAIRAPAAGVTLIEGGPGTGKTAVALHRAAHLLYRDRRRYEGAGVLLVGPSPVFMSYVERVLPSLGEDTAELRSLGQVVDGLSSDRLDPPALASFKGSLRMRRFLQRLIRQAPSGAPTSLRLVYGGEVLKLGADDLDRVRRELHQRTQHPNAAGPERVAHWRSPCGASGRPACHGPPSRSRPRCTTAMSSSASPRRGGRCSTQQRCWAGSPTPSGSATPAGTGCRLRIARRSRPRGPPRQRTCRWPTSPSWTRSGCCSGSLPSPPGGAPAVAAWASTSRVTTSANCPP
jgi:hypothetical protein